MNLTSPLRNPSGNHPSEAFLDALAAEGPAPDRADKMRLYGRFIGSWDMDVAVPGTARRGKGEIHFGWALEGRAVQDVWITPPRAKPADALGPVQFYGTTLRIYDPAIDAWHILWSDPVRQYYTRQIGRPLGPDIVQVGTDGAGARTRWSFTEITDNSFHWTGERSGDGAQWQTVVEFFARRLSA